jgi:hypothetical protein
MFHQETTHPKIIRSRLPVDHGRDSHAQKLIVERNPLALNTRPDYRESIWLSVAVGKDAIRGTGGNFMGERRLGFGHKAQLRKIQVMW